MILPAFIATRVNEIQAFNEPTYQWSRSYDKYRSHVAVEKLYLLFPDRKISRSAVIQLFKQDDQILAFVAAMIWGGISTGGVSGDHFSLALALETERLLSILQTAKQLVVKGQYIRAFQYFEGEGKIPGIGHSFHTKLIFFFGQTSDQMLKPLIFDRWSKMALCTLLCDTGLDSDLLRLGCRFKDDEIVIPPRLLAQAYEYYIHLVNSVADEINVTASRLEEFLFGCNRKQDNSNRNPRNYYIQQLRAYFSV